MSANQTLGDPRNGPIQRLMEWLSDDDKRTTFLAFSEPDARVLAARLNDLQWRADQIQDRASCAPSWTRHSEAAREATPCLSAGRRTMGRATGRAMP